MTKISIHHRLLGLGAALALSGCSVLKGTPVETFGNAILDFTGLGASRNLVLATENLMEAPELATPEQEYYIGRAVTARVLSIYKPYKNKELEIYLNTLGQTLAGFSYTPETFGGYHFMVLDTEEINALSAPGGIVLITKGLLDRLPDEDSLAAVLAHEITHITNQHGIKSISRDRLKSALGALGQVAGSFACGEVMQQAAAVFTGSVEDVVNTILRQGYNQEQEMEADQGAVLILARAGYNPYSILVSLERVAQAYGEAPSSWFSSHPSTADRVQKLTEFLEEKGLPSFSDARDLRLSRFDKATNRRGY